MLFNIGDVVTLGIGLLAAVIAVLAWRASTRAARATEKIARSTEEANQIYRQQLDAIIRTADTDHHLYREEIDLIRDQLESKLTQKEKEVLVQAELVTVGSPDAYLPHQSYFNRTTSNKLTVTNGSSQAIVHVQVVDIVSRECGVQYLARHGSRSPGRSDAECMHLDPGDTALFEVENIDHELHAFNFYAAVVVFEFEDLGGRRWRRVDNGMPIRAEDQPWDRDALRKQIKKSRIEALAQSLRDVHKLSNNQPGQTT
jgi:hypothetical protein